MRKLIVRLISGLIGMFFLAFGLMGIIPMGEYSVVRPERPMGFLLFGMMFAMYAITEFDFFRFFRKADVKKKGIIATAWAIILLGISATQFYLWWFRDMSGTLVVASISLLLGLSLLWIGFAMKERNKSA